MCPCNEFETIDVVEFSSDLITKQPTSTAGTDSPGLDIFRITPNEITKGAFVGDLLRARHHPDLVDRADLRAKTTVHA